MDEEFLPMFGPIGLPETQILRKPGKQADKDADPQLILIVMRDGFGDDLPGKGRVENLANFVVHWK